MPSNPTPDSKFREEYIPNVPSGPTGRGETPVEHKTPTGSGSGAAVPVLERTWAVVLLSAALLGETNVMPAWQCAAALALVVAGIWVVNRRAARGRRGGWCRKDTRPPCDTRLQCDADDQRAGASRRPTSSWPATQAATPRAKLSSMYAAAGP